MKRAGNRGYKPAFGTIILFFSLAVRAFGQSAAAAQSPQADNEYQTGAVLWQQSRSEVSALQYQAFHLARLVFDRDLRVHRKAGKPRAIVVDVDETVLDNSAFQAELIVAHRGYSAEAWTDWCNRARATAIPGSVEFLKYATARGARVFYVTNRRGSEKAGTIENLRKAGFPGVSEETVKVRVDASSKEPRRTNIARRYRIVLLCGDNLADFSVIFEGKTPEERASAAERSKAKFGAEFIVLPNPMYGDWESVIYGSGARLSEAEKAQKRAAALRPDSRGQ